MAYNPHFGADFCAVLHDPARYDHLPYIPFPDFWPTFTPKDKLGDWFEFYASALELNVWTSSTITASSWNSESQNWSVTVTGPRGPRELHPRHIILATGHSGEPNMPTVPGMEEYQGHLLCHSSSFPGARPEGKGRKAVVVGCCNSGHDIAQDYFEKGYDVTIVQRSTTYVMSSENGLAVLMKGLYDEDGVCLTLAWKTIGSH
jgi:cation diffusion facilitator CzcD-associated flavoprotein CzcO